MRMTLRDMVLRYMSTPTGSRHELREQLMREVAGFSDETRDLFFAMLDLYDNTDSQLQALRDRLHEMSRTVTPYTRIGPGPFRS
jgi:hypothetical protein